MAFAHKENTGSVFVNERKSEDTHPDRSGSALINGVEMWVNGWLRKTKDGEPYLYLTFKPKEEAQPKRGAFGSRGDTDDEIVF
jgi:hypothetical protein